MGLVLPRGAEQAGAWAVLAEDGVGGSAAAREGAGMGRDGGTSARSGRGAAALPGLVTSLLGNLGWRIWTHDQPMHR